MVFYGVDRIISQWTNDSSTWVAFDFISIGLSWTYLVVNVAWTGNTVLMFDLSFAYVTLQTYYCSDTSPNKYYRLNTFYCTDSCNDNI